MTPTFVPSGASLCRVYENRQLFRPSRRHDIRIFPAYFPNPHWANSPLTSIRRGPRLAKWRLQLSTRPLSLRTAPAVSIFSPQEQSVAARTKPGSDFLDAWFGMGRAPQERVENSLGSGWGKKKKKNPGFPVRSNGNGVTMHNVIAARMSCVWCFNDRGFPPRGVNFDATVHRPRTNENRHCRLSSHEGRANCRLCGCKTDSDRTIAILVLKIGKLSVWRWADRNQRDHLALWPQPNGVECQFLHPDRCGVKPRQFGGAWQPSSGELIGVIRRSSARSAGPTGSLRHSG